MLLIDDLLRAPGKAVFFLFEELARKAQEEWLDDDSVKHELQQIYALLDSGKIGESEFEAREHKLLERLEQIARVKFQSKWTEKPTTSDSGGPVIEGGVSARSFSEVLVSEAQPATAFPDPLQPTADPASSIGNKFSLGADFFEALRPFLDLPGSSTSSESEAAKTEPALGKLLTSSEAALVAERLGASSPSFDASPATSASDSKRSANQRSETIATSSHEASPQIPNAVSNESTSTPQMAIANSVVSPSSSGDQDFGLSGAVESAMRALSVTKLKTSSVTSVVRAEDGWCVSVELIERKAVPDTNDLLGVYEVHLNKVGVVTRYERTRVRRRNDLTR